MVNPFVSIDEQLSRYGWNKYYENENGFRYARKIGTSVFYLADFDKSGIKFYDDMIIGHDYDAIRVNGKTLELFAAKIKEWRARYGRNTKDRRHSSKERS